MPEPARRLAAAAVLAVLALAAGTGASARGPDAEQEAREIEAQLIAPCCFSQQVSVHHSAAADEVRQDIRKRLGAGETHEQILQAYVGRYGKRILAEPPAEGIARWLHILPPVALVLTAGLIVIIVRRFTSHAPVEPAPAAAGAASASGERYDAELDEQLRDLD